MKVYDMDLSTPTSMTAADLYTLGNANVLLSQSPARGGVGVIAGVLADGQTILDAGTIFGGTSVPAQVIQPSYYPKAVKGAECAAQVLTLDWANENLEAGYQYLKTAGGYFVCGVLNSTQTDANDPFSSADIIPGNVACWKEPYGVSYNPFG